MKYILLIVCLFLTGCVGIIPKKATSAEELQIYKILSKHIYTIGPGTVEYLGNTFSQAKYISGYAWKGQELGYFIIIIEEEIAEVFWSKDGEFPELELRLQMSIPPQFI